MSDPHRLRVLSIAHTAVRREAGRLRYLPLALRGDLVIHLLVPSRWQEFGRELSVDPPNEPGIDVRVEPIWFRAVPMMQWYMHVYPGLGRIVDEVRPDVLHLWEEPWSFVALQAALLKRKAALVLEVDQNILKTLPPPFEAIRRYVLSRTDLILSRHVHADDVVRARGYRGPIMRIGYGVNERTFFPPSLPRMRPAGEPLRIGYVGRLIPEKGVDDLLEALAQAPGRAFILGDGPHREALKAKAAALGLGPDRISWEGWRDPAGVGAFLRGLDVLALLTRTTAAVREQFGRVIIEAQACGVPVIGSSGGAIPDVIGEGGWVVPESNAAALAALLRRLTDDPAEVSCRAEAGRANVAARFTQEATAGILAEAWLRAARSRALGPAGAQQQHVGLPAG